MSERHERRELFLTLFLTTLAFVLILGGSLLFARELPRLREQRLIAALDAGNIALARERIEKLADPALARNYRDECDYREALERMDRQDWSGARALLAGVGDYLDAPERVKACDYQAALALAEEGEWDGAAKAFYELNGYADAAEQYDRCRYEKAAALAEQGEMAEAAALFMELGDYEDSSRRLLSLAAELTGCTDPDEALAALRGLSPEELERMSLLAERRAAMPKDRIAVGFYHTLGLKADGSVLACGDDRYGQCRVEEWRDITAVAAGAWHSLGLRRDGTVVAVGRDTEGQCAVGEWQGVVQITATDYASYALCADGTVLCAGLDNVHDLSGWTELELLRGGSYNLAALRADGRAVAAPHLPELEEFERLTDLSLSSGYAVGLRSDGRVISSVLEGEAWEDVVAVSAATTGVLALTADGRACGHFFRASDAPDLSGIRDALAVAAGGTHFAFLLSDGSVRVLGEDGLGQADTQSWRLF